jgi:hypothetical protein
VCTLLQCNITAHDIIDKNLESEAARREIQVCANRLRSGSGVPVLLQEVKDPSEYLGIQTRQRRYTGVPRSRQRRYALLRCAYNQLLFRLVRIYELGLQPRQPEVQIKIHAVVIQMVDEVRPGTGCGMVCSTESVGRL